MRILALALLAAYCLAPFLWQVVTSLKPAAELTALPPLLPSRVTMEHYAALFTGHPVLRLIANSAVVAAGTTALALVLGAAAAYAVSVLRMRGRGAILGVVLAISMFPPIATVSPLFLLLSALGLRDTLAALVLTYSTFSLPLAVWLLAGFFDALPRELYHAAALDGASRWTVLTRITLPLLLPMILVALLFRTIDAFRVFDSIYVLTGGGPANSTETLSIYAYKVLFQSLEFGYGSTLAVSVFVLVALVAAAYLFLLRRVLA